MVRSPFESLLGQETAVELLCRSLETQRLAPAYLFVGPDGVGRRLAALDFVESLLYRDPMDWTVLQRRIAARNHPDLLWIEPTYLHQGKPVMVAEAETLGLRRKSPPQIRLLQIREIIQFLARPPLEAPRAVVVIEGAETMAEAAANGLLKTLEEPGNACLILLALDSSALLPTIISRCQPIPFRRLSAENLATVLKRTGHTDILSQTDVLTLAQGSPGLAIAAWTQLQAMPEDLMAGLHQPPATPRQALEIARRISQELDTEAQLWLVDYLQHHYWQVQRSPTLLSRLEKARKYLRRYVQPRLVWEVTLLSLTAPA